MNRRTNRRLWTVMTLGGVMLLALALAGNTGGTCLPDDPTPACTADSECGGVPPVDCVGAWACQDGSCVFECDDPILPPERCYSDADCGAGEYCEMPEWDGCCPADSDGLCPAFMPYCEGVCRPVVPPPPTECWSDADCGPGMACQMSDDCWYGGGYDCEDGSECGAEMPLRACGGVCVPVDPPPPFECWSDADCGPGMACQLDANCFEHCPSDTECGAADARWACGGVCVPVEPPPVECWSDYDCGPGMACQMLDDCWYDYDCEDGADCAADPMFRACGGVCVAVEPPPVECWSDYDCGPGMACQMSDDCWYDYDCDAGADCGGSGVPMACGGVCVPVEPPPAECFSDYDCGPGMVCVVPDYCAGECPEEMGCDWICVGTCVPDVPPPPAECWSDADCGPGMRCQMDDWCWDANDCGPDGDCGAAGVWCGAGVCVPVEPPPAECWSDSDCRPGMRCQLDDTCYYGDEPNAGGDAFWAGCGGVCVPVEPPPAECFDNSDCGPGMACEFYENCNVPYCTDEGCTTPIWECPGRCVPVEPPSECRDDRDCGAGMRCDFPWQGECCLPGELCLAIYPACIGECVPDEPPPPPPTDCQADWDCAADERCQLDWDQCDTNCGPNMNCGPCTGSCVPIKECLSDADCPGGTVCDADQWGCPAWDCADGDADCMPYPCVGICREPEFGTQA